MLYLFLGYFAVGLVILLSIPFGDKLSTSQYAMFLGFAIFFDFLPTLAYPVGKFLSKSTNLHWITLVSFGTAIGIITMVILPEFGVGVNEEDSTWYLPAILFFAVGFIPQKFEFWRFKKA